MSIVSILTPEEYARRALAYHEAAHAVVAWSFQVRIHDIKIEGLQGRVRDSIRSSSLHPQTDYQKLEKLAVILWAGEAAEEALLNPSDREPAEHDRADLKSIVDGLFPDSLVDAERWLRKRNDEARARVSDHWPCVAALGEVLRVRDYVSGADAVRVIDNARTAANT
jgi:hypothetical protein